MIGLFNFFKQKAKRSLIREADISPFIPGLPAEDPAQALDDITHALSRLTSESNLKLSDRASKLTWLDQAAQHYERQIRHQYIAASRLTQRDEERIWTASAEFLNASINAHLEYIADLRRQQAPTTNGDMAYIAMRALGRLDRRALWSHLRYEPIPTDIWEKLFSLITLGEESHLIDQPGMVNSAALTQTSMKQELLKLLMLSVSAPERLTKTQIDLAHRLTHSLAEAFIWQDTPDHRTVFHIDVSTPALPARWRKTSEHRFRFRGFGPGEALTTLTAWLSQVAQDTIPQKLRSPDPALYRREDLWVVLTHLSQCWSRINPAQEPAHLDKQGNPRQPHFSRIGIVHDFNSLHDQLTHFQATVPMTHSPMVVSNLYRFNTAETEAFLQRMQTTSALRPDHATHSEIWVVESISRMGYGVTLTHFLHDDWLKPNIIIGIKPVAADWKIGIVRRLNMESHGHTAVGIQLLSTQPQAAMLRFSELGFRVPETTADRPIYRVPALLLPHELTLQQQDCLLIPSESYGLHHTYELVTGEFKRIVRLTDRVQRYHGLDKVMFEDVLPSPTDALPSALR